MGRGLVGGGAVAGGFVIAAGGAGAGIYAGMRVRRAIFGKTRNDISDEEERLISSIAALRDAIERTANAGTPISDREIALFAQIGLAPLVFQFERMLEAGVFDDLKRYYRIRLRGYIHTLRAIQEKLAVKP